MKEILPPKPSPSSSTCTLFPPCLPKKRSLERKYINLQLIWVACFTKNRKDFDWLHKLIFHLHYRATIYSIIQPANPESPLQWMPWPGAKIPGFFCFYHQPLLLHRATNTLQLLLVGCMLPTPFPMGLRQWALVYKTSLWLLPALTVESRPYLAILRRAQAGWDVQKRKERQWWKKAVMINWVLTLFKSSQNREQLSPLEGWETWSLRV